MGHASENKKQSPETITSLKRNYSECDLDVEHCIQLGGPPSTFTPYPGYRAILKYDGRFDTTHFRASAECANTSPAMIEYVKGRLEIEDTVFRSINWTSIGRISASQGMNQILQTSRMLFRWLLVGHNWYTCNLTMDVCPCCGANDETFKHLLSCKHEDLEDIRRATYIKIQQTCDKETLLLQFTRVFLNIIR